jgi:DNA-binding transcriptional LysR family regulator
MTNDSKIQAFLSLAASRSYTKTGKLLHMSQSSVSRLITALENDLGIQLFIRSTRSVELTPAGQIYYEFFHKFDHEYSEGLAQIKQELTNTDSLIMIGVQSYMDAYPIIVLLDRMKEEIPGYSARILAAPPSVILDHFDRGLLDFGVILSRFIPHDFNADVTELVVNPLYLLVSENNPKATDNACFRDFMDLPYISDVLEGEDSRAHTARLQHESEMWDLVPGETLWAYDRDCALMYAEFGYGIIIDSDRSMMLRDRKLKKYKTDKTEALILLHRRDAAAEDPRMGRVTDLFRDIFSVYSPR